MELLLARTKRACVVQWAVGILLAASFSLVQVASANATNIYFDDAPGTSAPPATLGGHQMMPFPPDPRAEMESVTGVSAPMAGTVSFSESLNHSTVGNSWRTWSHGYTGDVYWTHWSVTDLHLTLPAGTKAFYLYAEPANMQPYQMQATADDGTTSGTVEVNGFEGARYFGFYTTDNTDLVTITVSAEPDAGGFAVGEFGIDQDTGPHVYGADPEEPEEYITGQRDDTIALAAASDYSGVAEITIETEAGTHLGSYSVPCSDGCPPSVVARVPVDSGGMSEGAHAVRAYAEDDQGVTGAPWHFTMYVDNRGPAASTGYQHYLTRSNDAILFEWGPGADPSLADGAPGAGSSDIHYRFVRGRTQSSDWALLDEPQISLPNPTPGENITVYTYAVDAVGNQGATNNYHLQVPLVLPNANDLVSIALEETPLLPTSPGELVRTEVEPLLPAIGSNLALSGALADGSAPGTFSDGIRLDNHLHVLPEIRLVPVAASDVSGQRTDTGLSFTATRPTTDTVIRPAATGFRVSERMRLPSSAGDSLSWRVDADRARLVSLAPNLAAIVVPRDASIPNWSVDLAEETMPLDTTWSAAEYDDPRWELDRGQALLEAAQARVRNGWVVGLVHTPMVLDAAGKRIPTIVQTASDRFTISLTPTARPSYPVEAQMMVMAASASKCFGKPDRNPKVKSSTQTTGYHQIQVRAWGGINCGPPLGYKRLNPQGIQARSMIESTLWAGLGGLKPWPPRPCENTRWCYVLQSLNGDNTVPCNYAHEYFVSHWMDGRYQNRRWRVIDVPHVEGPRRWGWQTHTATRC